MTKQELYQAQQAVVNDRKNGVTNNTLANKVQSDANYDPYQGLAAYTPGNGGGQAQAAAQPTYSAPAESSGGWDGGASDYASQIQSVYEAQLAAQRAARQAEYDRAVAAQRQAYENNVNKVNSAADKAQKEAYINKMITAKNMGQAMAAQGLNGGYTESTAASMNNSYGNARNNIDVSRGEQLNDLNTTLQSNLAAAQSILSQGNNADFKDYTTNLANLIANNYSNPVSTVQGTLSGALGGTGSTAYTALQQLMAAGYSRDQAAAALAQQGYDISGLGV